MRKRLNMRSLRVLPYTVFVILCMNFSISLVRVSYFLIPGSVTRSLSFYANVWWASMTGYLLSHIVTFSNIFGVLDLSREMRHSWYSYIFATIMQSIRLNTMALIQRAGEGSDIGFFLDLGVSQAAGILEITAFWFLMQGVTQALDLPGDTEKGKRHHRWPADAWGGFSILFQMVYLIIRLWGRTSVAVSRLLLAAYFIILLLCLVSGIWSACLLRKTCYRIWLYIYNGDIFAETEGKSVERRRFL